jgi:hypothetical protein
MGEPILRGSNCDFGEAKYRRVRSNLSGFLGSLSAAADVEVLWPRDVLCEGGICRTRLDGIFVYGDPTHFSRDGSRLFAATAPLAHRIKADGR